MHPVCHLRRKKKQKERTTTTTVWTGYLFLGISRTDLWSQVNFKSLITKKMCFSGTDRNNMVETRNPLDNYPLPWEMSKLFRGAKISWTSLEFKSPKAEDIAVSLATAGMHYLLLYFDPKSRQFSNAVGLFWPGFVLLVCKLYVRNKWNIPLRWELNSILEQFSYDLEMKTREQNNKRKETEWFDWFIELIQTRVAFGWLSERTGEKTSCPKNFLEINRCFALTSYCNTVGQSNNAFSILGFSLAGKRRGRVVMFSSISW